MSGRPGGVRGARRDKESGWLDAGRTGIEHRSTRRASETKSTKRTQPRLGGRWWVAGQRPMRTRRNEPSQAVQAPRNRANEPSRSLRPPRNRQNEAKDGRSGKILSIMSNQSRNAGRRKPRGTKPATTHSWLDSTMWLSLAVDGCRVEWRVPCESTRSTTGFRRSLLPESGTPTRPSEVDRSRAGWRARPLRRWPWLLRAVLIRGKFRATGTSPRAG